MITQTTTLILGAGASMQFGFPSGEMLTRDVVNLLEIQNSREGSILQELGYSLDEINDFRDALYYSGKKSVDAFLEHRESFLSIGKAAMACCLIPRESKRNLFGLDENWYKYLFAAMNCKREDFASNRLSIVTFNYDRSLETFLHTCLRNTYGLSETMAAEIIDELSIIHIHGRLGRLPWQRGNEPERPYSVELSSNYVAAARDSIQIIHEGRYDNPTLQRASELINNAEIKVFLGFGYHKPNIERLQIDSSPKPGFVGGTGFGLTDREQEAVRVLFKNNLVVGQRHWNVLQFLRESVDLR